ncbi:hypothetical protein HS088_TW07G00278 [Tripterygium wilfordii]|uniref:RING-type E3 ubiquitin transferase n=1 Tax=Tripterygium wilfordii TaxID=458696 RepID=A0A7J7DEJ7_TRIWF|nr:probable E3 ubiquitin-protein ligase LOG2 [Tripterygium wilfordii]KAF5744699.1 hypothetical protein HS088_TW07G00278 [Tripterygium wilfordii]
MGNTASYRRSQHQNHPRPPHPPPPPQPEITGNQFVFAAASPYPSQYPQPQYLSPNFPPRYHQYPSGYYAPPYGYHRPPGGHYPFGNMPPPPPYVENQKAVTIRNDVNIKKETLTLEPDEDHPGKFLLAFTFDATAPGSITVVFFVKEGEECNLTALREDILKPVTTSFQQGLGQKFRQPSGSGIDFSMFDETELKNESGAEVYPVAVKAESCPLSQSGSEGNPANPTGNSQITLAVFEKKESGEYQVRVRKQILWVNKMRYELQEIYGIGNALDDDSGENDNGKECIVCLTEPRDTAVLPCRHMCMCSGCAKVLRFQTDKCPICRQPVEHMLEIKVNSGASE